MTSVTKLTAVYPGTFDPMTLGHEDLMRRASRLFERLILAVAAGHHKRTMFTIAERLEIAQELSSKYPNVEVIAFRGLLRDFVVAHGGKVVVRGLRAEAGQQGPLPLDVPLAVWRRAGPGPATAGLPLSWPG